jgi:hypothetical protein
MFTLAFFGVFAQMKVLLFSGSLKGGVKEINPSQAA